jgi:prevent-host-death family protein
MNDQPGPERISFTEFRQEMADAIDRVKYRGERLIVHRRGRDAVAVVPLEDLARLEAARKRPAAGRARKRPPGSEEADSAPLNLDSLRRELGL